MGPPNLVDHFAWPFILCTFDRPQSSRRQNHCKLQIKNGRYNNRINSWLNDRTSCDISYTWVDLGIRWFPRFVMKGQCQNEVSCSIPSGMYCQPNDERRIQFYRLVMSSYLSSVAEVQAHGLQREWDVFGLVFRFAFGTIFMVSKRLQRVEERLVQKCFILSWKEEI